MSAAPRSTEDEVALLRVYFGESDRVGGRPAAEALMSAAHDAGLAGATLFRGNLGYGADSVLHQPQPFRLSGDLPVVLEIVDDADRIDAFVDELGRLLTGGGLITVERVTRLRPGGGG